MRKAGFDPSQKRKRKNKRHGGGGGDGGGGGGGNGNTAAAAALGASDLVPRPRVHYGSFYLRLGAVGEGKEKTFYFFFSSCLVI